MIDRIIIENFKSLRRIDLSLGPLNLFIGTNASGKSNFLDALRVLQGIGNGFTISEILDGKSRSATSEVWEGIRGGSSNACFFGTNEVTITACGTLGVCRIGRTGVGEGEQGCWGRRNNNLGNKPSWGSAWRLIWDRIRAVNDSQRSVHGRRLSRA